MGDLTQVVAGGTLITFMNGKKSLDLPASNANPEGGRAFLPGYNDLDPTLIIVSEGGARLEFFAAPVGSKIQTLKINNARTMLQDPQREYFLPTVEIPVGFDGGTPRPNKVFVHAALLVDHKGNPCALYVPPGELYADRINPAAITNGGPFVIDFAGKIIDGIGKGRDLEPNF